MFRNGRLNNEEEKTMKLVRLALTFQPIIEASKLFYFHKDCLRFLEHLRSQNISTLQEFGQLNWRTWKFQSRTCFPEITYYSCEFIGREGVRRFLDLFQRSKGHNGSWFAFQLKLSRENHNLNLNCSIRPTTTFPRVKCEKASANQAVASEVPVVKNGKIRLRCKAEARACWDYLTREHAPALMQDSSLHEAWLASGILDIFSTYPELAANYYVNKPLDFLIMCGFAQDLVHRVQSSFNFKLPLTWYYCVRDMMRMAYELDTKIPTARLGNFLQWDVLNQKEPSNIYGTSGMSSDDYTLIMSCLILCRYDASLCEQISRANGTHKPRMRVTAVFCVEKVVSHKSALLMEQCMPYLQILEFDNRLDFDVKGFVHVLQALSEPGNADMLQELHLVIPNYGNQDEFQTARESLQLFINQKSTALQKLKIDVIDESWIVHGDSPLQLVNELLTLLHMKAMAEDENNGCGEAFDHGTRWSLKVLAIAWYPEVEMRPLKQLLSGKGIKRVSVCQPDSFAEMVSLEEFSKSFGPHFRHGEYELPNRIEMEPTNFLINHLVVKDTEMLRQDTFFDPSSSWIEQFCWEIGNDVDPPYGAIDNVSRLARLKTFYLTTRIVGCCRRFNSTINGLTDLTPCLASLLSNAPIETIYVDNDNNEYLPYKVNLKVLCDALHDNDTLSHLLLKGLEIVDGKMDFPAFLLDQLHPTGYDKTNLRYIYVYDHADYLVPWSLLNESSWQDRLARESTEEDSWEDAPPKLTGFRRATDLRYLLNLNRFGRGKVRKDDTKRRDLVHLLEQKPGLVVSESESEFCRDLIALLATPEFNNLATLYEMLLEEETLRFWVFLLQRDLEWFGVQHGLLLESPLLWLT